jgi:hypothetical protein
VNVLRGIRSVEGIVGRFAVAETGVHERHGVRWHVAFASALHQFFEDDARLARSSSFGKNIASR